mgnify:CR=1 FL=1
MIEQLKNIEYVLFDLDGTVSDSSEGIMKSADMALKSQNIVVPFDTLTKFIGPALRVSFSWYTDSVEIRDKMLAVYRERYSEKGWCENKIYNGMPELLRDLQAKGKHVVLASAKPEYFCRKIIKYFGVEQYFDFIGGSDMDGKRDDKTVLLSYVLDNVGNPSPDKVIMIGDRKYDVECAHNHGIKCIGVKYGFSDGDELSSAGADFIADTVDDLKNMLL